MILLVGCRLILASTGLIIAIALPGFFTVTILIYVFAIRLEWFPAISLVPTDVSVVELLPKSVNCRAGNITPASISKCMWKSKNLSLAGLPIVRELAVLQPGSIFGEHL